MPVTIAALAYGITAMVNLTWPRTPDASFVDNYIVLLSGIAVVVVGLVYMTVARPYEHEGSQRGGDAIAGSRVAEAAQPSGQAAQDEGQLRIDD